jgi:hypothetical protein
MEFSHNLIKKNVIRKVEKKYQPGQFSRRLRAGEQRNRVSIPEKDKGFLLSKPPSRLRRTIVTAHKLHPVLFPKGGVAGA